MKFPKLESKAVLSPMAGVTDVAFRELARKYGASLTYTEFVSSTAVVRGNHKTIESLRTSPLEKPVAVQLFGNSVSDVTKAAQMLEDQFNIVDINCGCPAWKVIKTGAGSAMLNNPEKIGTFINKLVSSVSIPVTIKIRAGIDEKNINAVQIAKIAQDAGAAAIGVHGRTQKQGYAGKADWNVIKTVKESVDIPVIGNGDVFSPEDFREKLEYSGVDYILIARGAMNDPYIFTQIKEYLKKGTYEQEDSITHFKEYLKCADKYNIPFSLIKNHAMRFTKGLVGGAKLRQNMMSSKNQMELKKCLGIDDKA